jgi:hypothetical protein
MTAMFPSEQIAGLRIAMAVRWSLGSEGVPSVYGLASAGAAELRSLQNNPSVFTVIRVGCS